MFSSFSSLRAATRLSLLKLLSVFPIYLTIARCAVIPPDNPLLPDSLSLLANPNQVDFHCVHQPQWRDIKFFEIGDCFGAFYMMQYMEGVDPFGPEVRKEFKTRSAQSLQPPGAAVEVPRKYVTGTCTLAILMRSEVPPGVLPAEDGRSTATNEVSSFREMGKAASLVYDMCGKSLKSPGWATVGERDGLAVALWATGSSIDQRYGNVRTFRTQPPPVGVPAETA
ncbi:MAG: hypothetical protein Q9178_006845 [Gyalolechia marmorata]